MCPGEQNLGWQIVVFQSNFSIGPHESRGHNYLGAVCAALFVSSYSNGMALETADWRRSSQETE